MRSSGPWGESTNQVDCGGSLLLAIGSLGIFCGHDFTRGEVYIELRRTACFIHRRGGFGSEGTVIAQPVALTSTEEKERRRENRSQKNGKGKETVVPTAAEGKSKCGGSRKYTMPGEKPR